MYEISLVEAHRIIQNVPNATYPANLQQGTEEWLQERNKRLTATNTATLFDDSSFYDSKFKDDILLQKLFGKKVFFNKGMKLGKKMEDFARKRANEVLGKNFSPAVYINEEMKALVSLDGVDDLDSKTMLPKTILEIKAVQSHSDIIRNAKLKILPTSYLWQAWTQLLVTGAEKVIYFVLDIDTNAYYAQEIRLPKDMTGERIVKAFLEFYWNHLVPKEMVGDKPEYLVLNKDEDFINLEKQYDQVLQELEVLEAKKEVIRGQLIDASNGEPAIGETFKIIRSESKGRVSWKKVVDKIALDHQIDLKPYTKPSGATSISYKITRNQ